MSEDLKLRQRILTRWGTLKKEREPYMTQWLEISEHITPSRGRFLIGKTAMSRAPGGTASWTALPSGRQTSSRPAS